MDQTSIQYYKFHKKNLMPGGFKTRAFIYIPLTLFLLLAENNFNPNKVVDNYRLMFMYLIAILIIVVYSLMVIIKELLIDSKGLSFKRIYHKKWVRIDYTKISHFCYTMRSRDLTVFLKIEAGKSEEVKRLQMNFSEPDIYEILSGFYRAGFKVLLLELYQNIEESDKYIPE